MPGNYLIIFLLVITQLHIALTHTQGFPTYQQPPSFLNSGIMYQDVTPTADEPVLVNANFISFKRTLNIEPLAVVLQQLREATKLYADICTNTTKEIDDSRLAAAMKTTTSKSTHTDDDLPQIDFSTFFVPHEKIKMGHARQLCQKHNASLPEVRSIVAFDRLKSLRILFGLDLIPAGIHLDDATNKLRFDSDNQLLQTANEFHSVFNYPGPYNTYNADDENMLKTARSKNLGYKDFGPTALTVQVFNTHDMEWQQRIICQRKKVHVSAQPKTVDNFVKFVCRRDPVYYWKTVNSLFDQADTFFNITGVINTMDIHTRLPKSTDTDTELLPEIPTMNQRSMSLVLNSTAGQLHPEVIAKMENIVNSSPSLMVSTTTEDLDAIFNSIKPHQNAMIRPPKMDLGDEVDQAHNRVKRFGIVPAVIAGGATILAGSNVAHSFINGGPMFGWAGSALARLFGWATTDQIQAQGEALLAMATEMKTLDVNVELIADQLENQREAILELQNYLNAADIALMNYFRLSDLANQLQLIILNVQISINNALLMLSDVLLNQYTPVLISPSELTQLKAEMLIRAKTNIDINFKNIETNLVVKDSKYHMIITMPIIEQSEAARLYKISTIPVYLNKVAYRAELDATNIAMFSGNVEYSVLTDEEMRICRMTPTACRVVGLKHTFNDKSLCVVQTFKLNNIHCKVNPTNETDPFYELHQNTLIFSVPQPVDVATDCEDKSLRSNVLHLSGVGQVNIPPGCQISTGNGKLRTVSAPKQMALTDSRLMEVISHTPDIKVPNKTELRPAENPFTYLPDFELKPMSGQNITAMILSAFQPGQVISFGVKLAIAFGIIFIVLACCCCTNRTCRVWFTSCTMIRPMQPWIQKANKMADKPSGKLSKLMAEYRRKARKQRFEADLEAEIQEALNHGPIIREPETPATPPPRPGSPLYLQMSPPPQRRQPAEAVPRPMQTFRRPNFWAAPRRPIRQASLPTARSSPGSGDTPPPRYNSYPPLPNPEPTRMPADQIIYETNKMANQMDEKMAVLHEEVKEVDQLLANYRQQQLDDGSENPFPALPPLSDLPAFDRIRPQNHGLPPSPATTVSLSSSDSYNQQDQPTTMHVQFAPQPPTAPLCPRVPTLPVTRPTTLQLQYRITDAHL
jgi:hypothetical protein